MMNLVQKVSFFIESHNLYDKHILLAVSGGKDSMCMLHIFKKLPVKISVLHCNFKLRENESNDDELFVVNYCKLNNIDVYTKNFNTLAIKLDTKLSIQETARNLRYAWFEEMRKSLNADYIATAHHANDNFETIIMNLARGVGVNSLWGIPLINGHIIRPFLDITSKDITNFCIDTNITYRTDSSNNSSKYKRNFVRNKITPHFELLNQNSMEHFSASIQLFNSLKDIINNHFESLKNLYISTNNEITTIKINELKSAPNASVFLLETLKQFELNQSQITEILASKKSGSKWLTQNYICIKHRDNLLIKNKTSFINSSVISIKISELTHPLNIEFNTLCFSISVTPTLPATFNNHTFYFDINKLSNEITIRPWQTGDVFHPFGSLNKQKISDYFINKKINLFEKEQSAVIEDKAKGIIALLPHTISELAKVDCNTTAVLVITIVK